MESKSLNPGSGEDILVEEELEKTSEEKIFESLGKKFKGEIAQTKGEVLYFRHSREKVGQFEQQGFTCFVPKGQDFGFLIDHSLLDEEGIEEMIKKGKEKSYLFHNKEKDLNDFYDMKLPYYTYFLVQLVKPRHYVLIGKDLDFEVPIATLIVTKVAKHLQTSIVNACPKTGNQKSITYKQNDKIVTLKNVNYVNPEMSMPFVSKDPLEKGNRENEIENFRRSLKSSFKTEGIFL